MTWLIFFYSRNCSKVAFRSKNNTEIVHCTFPPTDAISMVAAPIFPPPHHTGVTFMMWKVEQLMLVNLQGRTLKSYDLLPAIVKD